MRHLFSRAQSCARVDNCINDVLVAGAPAKIPRKRLSDFGFVVYLRLGAEKIQARHQKAGCAKTALQCVMVPERSLNGMEGAVGRKPLHRHNVCSLGLNGKHQAGPHGLTIEQNRAGSAHPLLATKMRAGQFEILPQKISEQAPRLNEPLYRARVHSQLDHVFCHGSPGPAGSQTKRALDQDAGHVPSIVTRYMDVVLRFDLSGNPDRDSIKSRIVRALTD